MSDFRDQTSVRVKMQRVGSVLGVVLLGLTLSGCFQAAGNTIEPTIANLTATPVAPVAIPTLPAVQPTLPGVEPSQPPQGAEPTQPQAQQPTAGLAPTFTPFITPIGENGFQTPQPTAAAGAGPTATAALFPPTQDAANPIPTIAATTGAGTDSMATPTALPTDPPCNYTVQQGDTFYAIARKLKLNPQDIIDANPRTNPNALQIGDVLAIPGCQKPTVPGPTAAPGATQGAAQGATQGPQKYTIQAGDTLGKIASRFGVTVQDIVRANNLPNENVILNIGQVLTIPAKP